MGWRSVYHENMPDGQMKIEYSLKDSWSNTSDWSYSGKTDYGDKIVLEYKSTIENTWEYWYLSFGYEEIQDPESGEITYDYIHNSLTVTTT